jgi:hypothetical protein
MRVKELIEILSKFDPNLEIVRIAGKSDEWYDDILVGNETIRINGDGFPVYEGESPEDWEIAEEVVCLY